MKRLIYVCSPLRGNIRKNLKAAAGYCKQVVEKGFTPYCPHLFYSAFLDDTHTEDREAGIQMGLDFIRERMDTRTDELWVFGPKVSEGMVGEILTAQKVDIPIINRGPLFSVPCEWKVPAFCRIRFYDRSGKYDDKETVLFTDGQPIFQTSEYPEHAYAATIHVLENKQLAGWSLFGLDNAGWIEYRDKDGKVVGYDSGRRN